MPRRGPALFMFASGLVTVVVWGGPHRRRADPRRATRGAGHLHNDGHFRSGLGDHYAGDVPFGRTNPPPRPAGLPHSPLHACPRGDASPYDSGPYGGAKYWPGYRSLPAK